MRREHPSLAIPSVFTIAAMAVLLLARLAPAGPITVTLRTLAGVPLVLVLPGYALSILFLPDGLTRPQHIHPLLWQGMWAVGLSLVLAVLGGLVLNLTPAGLTGVDWIIALGIATLLALAATAVVRRRQVVDRTVPLAVAPAPVREPAASRAGMHVLAAAGYALAVAAIAGAAIWLATFSAARQAEPGFAQLSMVPARGTSTAGVTLGLRNEYHSTERFRLVMQRGTRRAAAWDLTLVPGQRWRTTVTDPGGEYLRATLTMPGQNVPARVVTMGVSPSSSARAPAHKPRYGRTHAGTPRAHASTPRTRATSGRR